jgi:transcriptional regulator with XRE-family HTH domain
MDTLGERVRYARMMKALTLRDVRDQTGITIATLSRVENGLVESPHMVTIRKLADVLDVDAGWLLTGATVEIPKRGRQ